MSIRSLLVGIITDWIQKVSRETTRSDSDTKTEETQIARVLGEEYDFGCSSVAEAEAIKGLKHEGKYPQIHESF